METRSALAVRQFVLPHGHRIDDGEERLGRHRCITIELDSTVFTDETNPESWRCCLGNHLQVAFLQTRCCCIEGADLLQVGGGLHGRRIDDQHPVLPLVRRQVGQSETCYRLAGAPMGEACRKAGETDLQCRFHARILRRAMCSRSDLHDY